MSQREDANVDDNIYTSIDDNNDINNKLHNVNTSGRGDASDGISVISDSDSEPHHPLAKPHSASTQYNSFGSSNCGCNVNQLNNSATGLPVIHRHGFRQNDLSLHENVSLQHFAKGVSTNVLIFCLIGAFFAIAIGNFMRLNKMEQGTSLPNDFAGLSERVRKLEVENDLLKIIVDQLVKIHKDTDYFTSHRKYAERKEDAESKKRTKYSEPIVLQRTIKDSNDAPTVRYPYSKHSECTNDDSSNSCKSRNDNSNEDTSKFPERVVRIVEHRYNKDRKSESKQRQKSKNKNKSKETPPSRKADDSHYKMNIEMPESYHSTVEHMGDFMKSRDGRPGGIEESNDAAWYENMMKTREELRGERHTNENLEKNWYLKRGTERQVKRKADYAKMGKEFLNNL